MAANGSFYSAWAARDVSWQIWAVQQGAGLPAEMLNVDPNHEADGPNIAAVAGDPYTVWREHVDTDEDGSGDTWRVYVSKQGDGGRWHRVVQPQTAERGRRETLFSGGELNLDSHGRPDIAGIGTVPYVAYTVASPDNVRNQLLKVRRWDKNSGSWVQVGDTLNVDGSASAADPEITDVGGVPHVTWAEQRAGGLSRVYVKALGPAEAPQAKEGEGSDDKPYSP